MSENDLFSFFVRVVVKVQGLQYLYHASYSILPLSVRQRESERQGTLPQKLLGSETPSLLLPLQLSHLKQFPRSF